MFLDDFRSLYVSDSLFEKKEYHDSYLFDVLRRKYERKGYRSYDIITRGGPRNGDVITQSVLGQYMRHLKGERKHLFPYSRDMFPHELGVFSGANKTHQ
jgi:hypothetical protein